ncbi:hypothetical protein AB5J49_29890 [Streptomyces sp. R28]|uniref:Uncharacterized protein n=1 Tax=Streptomyces sp. R28 TaxID=3238628 RepID=A0AB39Q722_9ACTN
MSIGLSDPIEYALPKSLLTAALGGVVVLAGFGARNATADQTSVVSTVAASDDTAEVRFPEMADLISQSCAPDVSGGVDDVASASVAETPAAEPTPDSTLPGASAGRSRGRTRPRTKRCGTGWRA